MMATDISNALRDFEQTCDDVVDNCEPIIVTRSNNNNVVIISQSEYNNMLENIYVRKSPANYNHILESMEQAKQGHLVNFDLEDEND
jgi:antitoxin YefM